MAKQKMKRICSEKCVCEDTAPHFIPPSLGEPAFYACAVPCEDRPPSDLAGLAARESGASECLAPKVTLLPGLRARDLTSALVKEVRDQAEARTLLGLVLDEVERAAVQDVIWPSTERRIRELLGR